MIEPNKHIKLFSESPSWLVSRGIEWKDKFTRAWLNEDDESYIQARCDYFFTGDSKTFINSNQKPALIEVILYSPKQSLEDIILAIHEYCEWIFNNKVTWGDTTYDNIEQKLFDIILVVLRENSYLSTSLVAQLFTYFFGEQYAEQRTVTFEFSVGKRNFISPYSGYQLSSTLKFYIGRYLYEAPSDRSLNTFTAKHLVDFYFSVAGCIDERVFSTQEIEETEVLGEKVDDGSQRLLRWLIARMLGYITEYEEDEGINKWFVNDAEFEAEFKRRWNEINWPPAYDKLVEFIHKHKGQCLFEND